MAESAEFDLIKQYFTPEKGRKDVTLGVGDDCALLMPPAGKQLAVTVDTLVSGVHFPIGTSPADIAYKAIVVSLSDLAAMGAEPAWVMLVLTLPEINHDWLTKFSQSLKQTLGNYNVQLVGGDTTRGPLSITVQATGFIDARRVMKRATAKAGDSIYVTGVLGDAALGLALLSSNTPVDKEISTACLSRLNRPTPRVEFALAATEYCSCAIDVSDGLSADLGHILQASRCGAEIYLDKIPVSDELEKYFSDQKNNSIIDWNMVLSGGDDYELCMCVSDEQVTAFESLAKSMKLPLTCVGKITTQNGLSIIEAGGKAFVLDKPGYEHFAKNE